MIQTETLQKYIDVFSQMTIPIATVCLEGLLISVNEAFCHLFGYKENELIGKKIPHPFWAEEDIENIKKGFNEIVVQGKTGMAWDMIFAKKDGTRIPVSVVTSELKDEDGKIMGYSGFFEDISSRKKAEEALRKSQDELEMHVKERTAELAKSNEELLNEITEHKKVEEEIKNYQKKIETLINSSTDYIFLKDVNFRYIIANKIHEELFNKRVEDIIGKTDFDFMPKAVAEQCRKSDEEALKSGFVSKEEFIDERCFHIVKQRVVDEKGKVIGIAAVIREITERKKAEEVLQVSEKKFRDIAETTTDWIWEVDAKGVYTYASPKVKELLGYEVNEVLGKTPFDLMPKEEAKRVEKIFKEKVIKKEPFSRLENINRHKDGRLVVLETSGIPILDEKGQMKGYRGIDRDITERKKTEDALRESESQLMEQKQALEQKNIALKEILEQIEIEKKRIRDDVVVNINDLILPILRKIRLKGAPRKYVNLIKNHLDDLTSSFGRNIAKENLKLSPREIEICDFIKSDISSKEISNLLNISRQTIDRHRKNIRKKLGICNKNVNLTSYLRRL